MDTLSRISGVKNVAAARHEREAYKHSLGLFLNQARTWAVEEWQHYRIKGDVDFTAWSPKDFARLFAECGSSAAAWDRLYALAVPKHIRDSWFA